MVALYLHAFILIKVCALNLHMLLISGIAWNIFLKVSDDWHLNRGSVESLICDLNNQRLNIC